MSHFPIVRSNDHTSPYLKAETRETNSAEVRVEIEEERQAIEVRTARLRAMRLARESIGS
jgi:hypothetical protein